MKKNKLSKLRKREEKWFYILISPWVIGFLGITLGPMLFSLYTSFTSWNGISTPKFIGITNYITMFTQDDQFLSSLWLTFKYVLIAVPTSLVFALLLAVLLSRDVRGSGFFQALYYFPSIVAGTSIFIVWKYMFDPTTGVINYLLSLLGIDGPGWLASTEWAMPALIIMNLFFCGQQMLIFIAGIKQVPVSYYEAAEIDGAGPVVSFFKITLPMLVPLIAFNLIMNMIGSIQVFSQSFVMTGGGPAKSTYFYVYYLYDTAFRYSDFSYASAMSWVMFLIIFLLSMLVLKMSKNASE